MGRTVCTEPQCLYKRLHFTFTFSTSWTPKGLSRIAYGLLNHLLLGLLCIFVGTSDQNFVNIFLFPVCYTSTYLIILIWWHY